MRDTDRRGCVVSAISVRCARRSPGQYMRPVVPMRGGCLRGRYNDVINPTDDLWAVRLRDGNAREMEKLIGPPRVASIFLNCFGRAIES